MRRLWLALLGLVIVVIAVAWFLRRPGGPTLPARPADVVLITIDACQRDHLGAYGADESVTPALDSLALEGVLFEDAVTPAPLTAAGLASILTGRVPIQHRQRMDAEDELSPREVTLPEILSEAGYRSAAFLSARMPVETGLTQGFDLLAAPDGPERHSRAMVADAVQWYAQMPPETPGLLWFHIAEPRGPWLAPQPWALRHLDHPYRGELAAADEALGALLAGLADEPRFANAHVIILAPTGEGLGQEGEREHGILLGEATLRVPWLWILPEHLAARTALPARVPGLSATTDLLPTLLELLDIARPSNAPVLEGRSLAACLLEGMPSPRQLLLIETFLPSREFGWSPLLGLRTADRKLVLAPEPRLYDLQHNPRAPLAPNQETVALIALTRKKLELELQSLLPNDPAAEAWQAQGAGRTDPYSHVALSASLIGASRALQLGDAPKARQKAGDLAKRFPENPRAQLIDAFIKLRLGNPRAAEQGFRVLLDQLTTACEARQGLGEALLALDRAESALAALGSVSPDSATCLRLMSPSPDAPYDYWYSRGLALARSNRLRPATAAFTAAARVAARPAKEKHARRLGQSARFLADLEEREIPLQEMERAMVVRSAIELGTYATGYDLLAKLSGSGSAALDPYSMILDACVAALRDDGRRAVALMEESLELGGARAGDCRAVAMLLDEAGESLAAQRLLQKAAALFARDADLQIALAHLAAGHREEDLGLIHLESGLRLGFNEWDQLLKEPLRRLCRSPRVATFWTKPPPS